MINTPSRAVAQPCSIAKTHFGTTIYTDKKAHHRYRAWWWTLSEGWHRGWISAKPKYTDRGACGQIT